MKRSFVWSRVGTCPVVKTPVTRTVTHAILGAVTVNTVVHLSLRKPAPPKPKPRKVETNKGKKKDVGADAAVEEEQENEGVEQYQPDDDKPAPKGTTSAHYIKLISEVLDVVDEIGNMEGFYLVMTNQM
jgi:hypothetical protein